MFTARLLCISCWNDPATGLAIESGICMTEFIQTDSSARTIRDIQVEKLRMSKMLASQCVTVDYILFHKEGVKCI